MRVGGICNQRNSTGRHANPEVVVQVAAADERWRGKLYCLLRWLCAAGPGVGVHKVSDLRVASDTITRNSKTRGEYSLVLVTKLEK